MRDSKILPPDIKSITKYERVFKAFFCPELSTMTRSRMFSRSSRLLARTANLMTVYRNRRRADSHTTLFIYHPLRVTRDPQYWKMLRRLEPGQRALFRKLWRKNEEQRFYDRSREQLDAIPAFRPTKLVVVRRIKELYKNFIFSRKTCERSEVE